MLERHEDLDGWVRYECSECHLKWHMLAEESPESIKHTPRECWREQQASAELVELRKQFPGRTFARSALTGRWRPV